MAAGEFCVYYLKGMPRRPDSKFCRSLLGPGAVAEEWETEPLLIKRFADGDEEDWMGCVARNPCTATRPPRAHFCAPEPGACATSGSRVRMARRSPERGEFLQKAPADVARAFSPEDCWEWCAQKLDERSRDAGVEQSFYPRLAFAACEHNERAGTCGLHRHNREALRGSRRQPADVFPALNAAQNQAVYNNVCKLHTA